MSENLEAMSKKQLIEIIADLKQRLKSNGSSPEIDVDSLDKIAVSLERDGDTYCMVKILYNTESKVGIVSEKIAYPKQPHMAAFNARKILDVDILLELQRRK